MDRHQRLRFSMTTTSKTRDCGRIEEYYQLSPPRAAAKPRETSPYRYGGYERMLFGWDQFVGGPKWLNQSVATFVRPALLKHDNNHQLLSNCGITRQSALGRHSGRRLHLEEGRARALVQRQSLPSRRYDLRPCTMPTGVIA